MKKSLLLFHRIISWFILFIIFLVMVLFFVLESPSIALEPLKSMLKEQGVSYGEIEGGVLSGFRLKDVNYNNQVKAKEVSLKVDFEQLKDRVLYIDKLVLDEVEIDREFLASFIDSNSSDENKSEENITLPFDRVVVNSADISLKNIAYNEYQVYGFKLHINQLDTDMSTHYQGDVNLWLNSNVAQADLNGSFKDDNYHVSGIIEGEKEFINPFVSEQNVTLLSNPRLTLNGDGDLQNIDYDIKLHRLDLKQNTYEVHSRDLHTFGKYSIAKRDVVNTINTRIESNVGNLKLDAHSSLNLNDINSSLLFNVDTTFKPKKSSIVSTLKEQNITIQALPTLRLFAKGDMKSVNYTTTIKGLKAKQNGLALNLKDLELKGEAKPLDGDVSAKLLTQLDSSLAGGKIDAQTTLNYKDVNNTLKFSLNADLNSHGTGLSQLLKESNLTIEGDTPIKLMAKGDMNSVVFSTLLKGFRGKQNDIAFDVKTLDVKGRANPLKGDVEVEFMTDFDSTVADGEVSGGLKLNSNDINNSLVLDNLVAKIDAHASYVNPLLKEQEVKLQGDTHLELKAKGGFQNLQLDFKANSKVIKDKKLSHLTVDASPIELNLLTHHVKGSVDVKSTGGALGLNISSKFSGDYMNPKAMKLENKVELDNLDAFGVNLSSLKPFTLDMKNEEGSLLVRVNSPKLQLEAKSADNDHFTFKLKSDGLYPAKIVELPRELKDSFIKADIEGEVTLSKNYFKIKGFIDANEGFKAYIDAQNDASGLDAKLSTKHLKLLATGNLEKREIEAVLDIDSVTALEKELVYLYPFTVTPINGPLHAKVKMKGEEIYVKLNSPKLKMEGFNIESLDVDAHYAKELVTLNKLSFKTTGFEDKKLNRDFYLNQKGKIYLGEKRDILIDMHPKILVKGTGTVENMSVDASIEGLPLGHPEYGSMILSTQINYSQIGKKRKIVGGISLEKMKIFYEAKFLDAAHDPDVVVITKKDKNKKKESDSFLEDTYIDLAIYAPDAEYKTRDIELEFTVDVSAKKKFAKSLGMLGKVRDINGRVEQAPKLFTVVDSNIVFRGLKDINPLLDIKVEHELPDVLITINIHGDANRPKLDFTSDPSMAKKDILSYLLLGVSTANLSEGGGSLGREAQLFIMNQAARDFAYEVELDRVFIKDDGTGEGYAIQVGKKINDDSMLILENSKEGNSFILEYDVSKNIKVEVGHHQKTIPSQSIDIFFRKRFK